MLRRLAVLLGVVVALGVTSTTRADDANRECDNDEDVTMVVDFQRLGGGVNVRCAPQPIKNGFDVFRRANVSFDQFQGFVCRIAGRPESASCDRYPPADAYWVYWIAERGGEWKYSSQGASARRPPPGSVDGWAFFLKAGDNDKPSPPNYPVPPPIPAATTTSTSAVAEHAATAASTAPGPTRVRRPAPVGASTTHTLMPTTTTTESVATTSTTVMLGNVDLSVDGGGTSVGFIASAAAVVGVAAVAAAYLRRRGR